jgi:hypothetical protein
VTFSRPLPDPFLRGKGLLAFNIFLIIIFFLKKKNVISNDLFSGIYIKIAFFVYKIAIPNALLAEIVWEGSIGGKEMVRVMSKTIPINW